MAYQTMGALRIVTQAEQSSAMTMLREEVARLQLENDLYRARVGAATDDLSRVLIQMPSAELAWVVGRIALLLNGRADPLDALDPPDRPNL